MLCARLPFLLSFLPKACSSQLNQRRPLMLPVCKAEASSAINMRQLNKCLHYTSLQAATTEREAAHVLPGHRAATT